MAILQYKKTLENLSKVKTFDDWKIKSVLCLKNENQTLSSEPNFQNF